MPAAAGRYANAKIDKTFFPRIEFGSALHHTIGTYDCLLVRQGNLDQETLCIQAP